MRRAALIVILLSSATATQAADTANSRVTDAVTQTNVCVLGEAPAMAMGDLFQTTSRALGMIAQNAAMGQQNAAVISEATTTQGVALLYGVDTASTAVGISQILSAFGADIPQ